MSSTEKFLEEMAAYNQGMHSLIDAGLVKEHGTISIDLDGSSPNDQKGVTMPESNEHDSSEHDKWDNWCHLRANNPSHSEWWWLVAAGLALIGVIAAGVKVWMMTH